MSTLRNQCKFFCIDFLQSAYHLLLLNSLLETDALSFEENKIESKIGIEKVHLVMLLLKYLRC